MKSPSVLPLSDDVSRPGVPVPRPLPSPVLSAEALAWLRWSLRWLCLAALAGLASCMPVCAARWLPGVLVPPEVPYVFQSLFLAGWVWMGLFAAFVQAIPPECKSVLRLVRLLRDGWNVLVAVAACSVWGGVGSGFWWMPAAPWLVPCFLLLMAGSCCVVGMVRRAGVARWAQAAEAGLFALGCGVLAGSWLDPWGWVPGWCGWAVLMAAGLCWVFRFAGSRGVWVRCWSAAVWSVASGLLFGLPAVYGWGYPLGGACLLFVVASVWALCRLRRRHGAAGGSKKAACDCSWRMGVGCAGLAAAVAGACFVFIVPMQDAAAWKSDGARVLAGRGCLLCHACGPVSSVTGLGPSLDGLMGRVQGKVSVEERMVASPREWLYLHLYNPGDRLWGKVRSACPAMPGLFEERDCSVKGRSPEALPVRVSAGRELVPSPAAVALVDFLSSLEGAAGGAEDAAASQQVLLAKGKRLYLSKCAVCHGRNGAGDAVNYPPLEGSEWLVEDDARLRDVIRNGLEGKIKVKGREWDSLMLPPGVTKDEDAEAIIRYLKAEFAPKPKL
ncbi:cytochrome c [Akkermansia glycaniphila]|uniref:Cytochrome c oxidase cbb3-type subunit iii n=1 Tax=Akkermansia glycaniphila TaxID=1679444 RepID=A0A1H6MBG0_9BACT|nr:cytochrome c [Akkermansia glycaniphila]SEH95411.1 cytochrome c oxidase cbb3-type subunit iii [Akkermansia glycaniphila]